MAEYMEIYDIDGNKEKRQEAYDKSGLICKIPGINKVFCKSYNKVIKKTAESVINNTITPRQQAINDVLHEFYGGGTKINLGDIPSDNNSTPPKIEIPKNIQGNLNKNRPVFAINTYDPLVFDLNGDGKINIINSQTYFDYEGDGIKEAGYWLDKFNNRKIA